MGRPPSLNLTGVPYNIVSQVLDALAVRLRRKGPGITAWYLRSVCGEYTDKTFKCMGWSPRFHRPALRAPCRDPAAAPHGRRLAEPDLEYSHGIHTHLVVKKRLHFCIHNASFYQDRLGTSIGKALKQEWRFLRDVMEGFVADGRCKVSARTGRLIL
jgi:hypothetical protein